MPTLDESLAALRRFRDLQGHDLGDDMIDEESGLTVAHLEKVIASLEDMVEIRVIDLSQSIRRSEQDSD